MTFAVLSCSHGKRALANTYILQGPKSMQKNRKDLV